MTTELDIQASPTTETAPTAAGAAPVALGPPALAPAPSHQQNEEAMSGRIEIEGLNVFYGDFRAVRDISLTVKPHAITAIIGPSGCGKSTFLRTLNRMHELTPSARSRALVGHDAALALDVITGDAFINEAQRAVSRLISVTIATQQPVARDLRYLLTLDHVTYLVTGDVEDLNP